MTYLYIGKNEARVLAEIEALIKETIPFTGTILDTEVVLPDIHLLVPGDAPSIGVDAIRVFTNKMQKKPFRAAKQFGIILGFEKATVEAQNMLLKELEDHPDTSVYILAISEESLLLPTIKSRSTIRYIDSVAEKKEHEELRLLAIKMLDSSFDIIDVYQAIEEMEWSRSTGEQLLFELYSVVNENNQYNALAFLELFQQSSAFLRSNVSAKHVVLSVLFQLRT